MLFSAGSETTRSAIGGSMLAFIQNPDQLQKLRDDQNLMRWALEEIVRWTTPTVYKRRTVMADTEIGGQAIKANQKVTVWEMSANRDESKFDRPFEFDIARKPNRHIGFGAGVHFCLGANLARLEIRTVLEELLTRYKGFELAGEPRCQHLGAAPDRAAVLDGSVLCARGRGRRLQGLLGRQGRRRLSARIVRRDR